MSGQAQTRVLLATLIECKSARWAGASNVVGFRGNDDDQGRPTWNLYLAERPARTDDAPDLPRP